MTLDDRAQKIWLIVPKSLLRVVYKKSHEY